MLENALTIIQSFRVQDLLDIAIIAVMISALLIWFKDRASRFVFMGIVLLGLVYLLAEFFQLYLTTVVLQAFFAILLFVLVVIFQEDLRRFFERLAMLGRFQKRFYTATSFIESAEIIAQTAADLARKKVGALIVVKGDDLLERHLTGGHALEGILSQPLLESIFDPHSVGHDGAVIVDGNRVVKFGCHLPLSANAAQHGTLGLRHTAALGLSERSDALCVVVSEERGTISLAKGEEIVEIPNASALRIELESFLAKRTPQAAPRPLLRWLKQNPREKILAVILACALWVAFGYQRETIRREYIVPIEYVNIPFEWRLEEPRVMEAKVMFSGPAQAFQIMPVGNLKISIDLSQIRPGTQEIALGSGMIKTPSGVNVVRITPERIKVTASRLIPLSVPVEVLTENSPPQGLVVDKISILPAEVKVLIPRRLKGKKIRVLTEPIDLSLVDVQKVFTPSLRYPLDVQFAGGKPPAVRVIVKTRPAAAPRR